MDGHVPDLLLGEARSAARHLCKSTTERQFSGSETSSLAPPSDKSDLLWYLMAGFKGLFVPVTASEQILL